MKHTTSIELKGIPYYNENRYHKAGICIQRLCREELVMTMAFSTNALRFEHILQQLLEKVRPVHQRKCISA